MTKNFIISFLLVAFSWLLGQPYQSFFLDDWESKEIEMPQSIDAEKPLGAATVSVTMDVADTVTRVCKYIFGNNANTWSGKMHNHKALVTNISNMKPNVIRYPGGNLSSDFFWNREQNDRPDDIPKTINPWYGMTQENWIMAVDDFYLLLQKTNSVGIITVNYSYARYGLSKNPVEKAAHLAAEWVRYDAGRTTFWEIGNENFGNWQSGYEIDVNQNQDGQPKRISGDLYGKHALVFIDSMRSAAAEISHEIKIGVQTFEAETSWDPVQTDWNEKMFAVIGNAADFFIVHNYYTNYDEDSNAQTILATFNKSASFKKAVYKDAVDAGVEPKPLSLTEWNIFAVRSMQQVSHINGLHASLVLGQLIQDEYGSAMRWDLANGWGNGDDHGTFSRADEPGVPEFSPRPVFYHMTYFQKYFGDVMVSTRVSGSRDLIAFASSFSNGPAGIVVV
ncbi:MAG: alpha-L-arabinofuranosidase, partial [Calditrichaeota bacterium]